MAGSVGGDASRQGAEDRPAAADLHWTGRAPVFSEHRSPSHGRTASEGRTAPVAPDDGAASITRDSRRLPRRAEWRRHFRRAAAGVLVLLLALPGILEAHARLVSS